jgi:hypothetical protein
LTNQPRPARAERETQGKLLAARGRSRQHKVADVRARDEQDDADDAHQDAKRR